MEPFIRTIRNHPTTLENNPAASSARESPKTRLVYAVAVACLIAFSVSLYLGTWLRH